MAILKWLRRGAPESSSRYGALGLLFNAMLLLALVSPAAAKAADKRLMLLGDSLVAGYGLPTEEGFVAQLGGALAAKGVDATMLNAGVSGDTTAGGRARLAWSLADKPTHAMVSLGANDALRGLDPGQAKENLAAILSGLKDAGVAVLLVGMQAPRNWGADYAEEFDRIYPELAETFDVPLYPFFLEGVALNPTLNQDDGIHPNAAGVAVIVERIAPAIEALLQTEPGA